MPGYIGNAYEFSVDGTFDSAKLSFTFDEELLKDKDFDPIIYYYNENIGMEEMPTSIHGNTATTETTHFSKYILLNRKEYENHLLGLIVLQSMCIIMLKLFCYG